MSKELIKEIKISGETVDAITIAGLKEAAEVVDGLIYAIASKYKIKDHDLKNLIDYLNQKKHLDQTLDYFGG